MAESLPDEIQRFVQAVNTRDLEAFGRLFAADAIVHDEKQQHCGVEAIKQWLASTAEKYRFTMSPHGVSRRGGETILKTDLSGDFPGSPITLDYHFTLTDGKITRLEIK
jgi:ketosteroid isomerase-like protein